MSPLLEARALGYSAGGARLLADVDLVVQPGQLLAVAGPNGAGKSTMLKLLAGDLEPETGGVLLAGRPIRSYPPRELALLRAVLPQQTVLQFAFTAEQVVELGRSPHRRRFGGAHPDDGRAVREAMMNADAQQLAKRTFPTLSSGEQARVTLARTLAQETKVLLLDEPTAALDLRHQQLVMSLARELTREGRIVVAVVHDLNLAARHADAVALLKEGELVASGSPWAVLTPPTLEDVFDHSVLVLPHPTCERPLVVTQ